MKPVVIFALLLGAGMFAWNFFLSGELVKDRGHFVAVAFGVPTATTQQMHIAIAPGLPIADPPDPTPNNRGLDWDKWIQEHFQLKDESGAVIPLQRIGTSGLFTGEVAAGSPDFALWTHVTKNQNYTCDYVPNKRKANRYRYSFTVPSEPEKVGMKQFDPVEGG